jgi:hypothetical protein
MPRYLIELPHAEEKHACAMAIKVLLETGSHFLTNADFGCCDGIHKAWMIVELPDKESVRSLLPPMYKSDAMIVELNKFTLEQIDRILSHHKDSKSPGQTRAEFKPVN